jgi:hypothetical protein
MGGTIIVPVQDILMEIPNFQNAPDFDFWNGMNGGMPIGGNGTQGRKTQAQREQELIDLIHDLYPDAISIRIWRGNVIIRLP